MANFLVLKNVEIGIKSLKLKKPSIWSAMYVISGLDPQPGYDPLIEEEDPHYSYRNVIKVKTLVLRFEDVLGFKKDQNNIEEVEEAKRQNTFIKFGRLPCYTVEIGNADIFFIRALGKYESLSDNFKTLPGFDVLKFDVFLSNITEDGDIKFYEDIEDESIRLIIEVGEEDTL